MNATPKFCPNGHARIPENRTNNDKCRVCARVRRTRQRDQNQSAKRAKRDRDRTAVNLVLRDGKSVSDQTCIENQRASRIFALMDALELAHTRADRNDIQQAIRKLAGKQP